MALVCSCVWAGARLHAQQRTYRRLREAGVRVAIGGDYGFRATPQGGQAADLGYFVEHFGYSAVEALECGTCVLAPLTMTRRFCGCSHTAGVGVHDM